MKKLMESGAMGVLPALASKNPDMLRGFGLVGNVEANKMDDREEKKKAEAAAAGAKAMKKGGAVKMSSASKRADGCAQRGKTKGRMV
jgi:hypothetical protein